VQHKWFRADGRKLLLDEAARAGVCFVERNLASEDEALWQKRSFDVIFCRNGIMYFAPEQARALLARIAPGIAAGRLFVSRPCRGVAWTSALPPWP
jgi:chemotaxis methyl-accepting protein methylase